MTISSAVNREAQYLLGYCQHQLAIIECVQQKREWCWFPVTNVWRIQVSQEKDSNKSVDPKSTAELPVMP